MWIDLFKDAYADWLPFWRGTIFEKMGCGIFFTSYFDLQQLTARLHYDKSMTEVSILYSTGIVPVYFKYIYLFGQVTGPN